MMIIPANKPIKTPLAITASPALPETRERRRPVPLKRPTAARRATNEIKYREIRTPIRLL
ncbi:MAG: hypothetical protein EPN25_08110 [Nitrospirae bacterium]|nr:MAG: hypothetical protein EPN25_08110 [Nitrospirota bacterium]